MKFIDPMPYDCPVCGHEASKTVQELISEKAVCDACSASLGAIGRQMNELIDKNSAFYYVIMLVMRIETNLGIEVPDEAIEKVRPWGQMRWLTVREIAMEVHSIANLGSLSSVTDSVVTALREEWPKCSGEFDIDAPLFEVIRGAGGDS